MPSTLALPQVGEDVLTWIGELAFESLEPLIEGGAALSDLLTGERDEWAGLVGAPKAAPAQWALLRVRRTGGAEDLAAVADLTEVGELIRRRDALERQRRDLIDLLSTLSHDLKQPIMSIDGLLQFIEEDGLEGLSEANREHFRMAADECRRMQALVGQISRFTRIGRAVPSTELIHLREALQDLAERFREEACQVGASLFVEADEIDVLAPWRPIEEAVGYLIDNAIRHGCPQPGLTVRLSGRVVLDVGARVLRIDVADEGPGIAPSHQDRMFQLFRRLNPAQPGGPGVGLTAARTLARRVGGDVIVESAPGAGARFVLTAPAAIVTSAVQEPQ